MNKTYLSLVSSVLLAASSSLYAATNKPANPTTLSPTNSQPPQIILYSQPSTNSQVVEKVDLTRNLVAIFRQNDWVKVGDPSNGNVGWVNSDQYAQAISAANQTTVSSYFVQTHSNNGQPPQITAYVNGQKLNQEQAEKLLQEIHLQQLQTQQEIETMQQNMNHLFGDSLQMFTDFPATNFQPVIIVTQPTNPTSHTTTNNNLPDSSANNASNSN